MGTKLVSTEVICALWSQPDTRQVVEGHTHLTPSIKIVSIHKMQRLESKVLDWQQSFFASYFSIEHVEIAGSLIFEWLAPNAKVVCQCHSPKSIILA